MLDIVKVLSSEIVPFSFLLAMSESAYFTYILAKRLFKLLDIYLPSKKWCLNVVLIYIPFLCEAKLLLYVLLICLKVIFISYPVN